MENQMQAQPKAQARLENLPAAQREAQWESGAKVTEIISYVFPLITLINLGGWLVIAGALFGDFQVGGGGECLFTKYRSRL